MTVAKKKEGPHNIGLKKAILALKSQGIIRFEKEIAEKMEYSRGTFSEYARGILPASEDFISQFEKQFGLKIASFEHNSSDPVLSMEGLKKYTLQDYINKIESQNAFLEEMMRSNFADIKYLQQVLYSYARTNLDYQAAVASRGDKKKEVELRDSLSKMLWDNSKKDPKNQNEVYLDRPDN